MSDSLTDTCLHESVRRWPCCTCEQLQGTENVEIVLHRDDWAELAALSSSNPKLQRFTGYVRSRLAKTKASKIAIERDYRLWPAVFGELDGNLARGLMRQLGGRSIEKVERIRSNEMEG